ncbi:FKBP-type peptidyl-prolyl cis-trans isomerase [Rhodanobacter sp. DHG33]|uniref:FKBP-type peptidyl-prolyl cis-trans isomerase n=1 Tax=Rhodanobacter sp. DHG33 TaxID=2775921 RepID=UPI00177BD9B9|nr:FKBP-type peptidyl-prolyl cis-trans isomerase [Rhodanobacter sp. DHG33]MBD8899201.1 FKBP-type peptidyl-prolyl cis-trans isomerase [Rhodanobacter sp. DHG33]
MCRLSIAFATVLLGALVATPLAWAADKIVQLQKTDIVVGHGSVANDGDVVEVNYTGWLYDADAKDHHGTEFDSSEQNGEPISFTLGAGEVIAGWDQGIRGMHVGGKRTLVIPARLAYGSRGAGDAVPPDATLVFDVELVGVR